MTDSNTAKYYIYNIICLVFYDSQKWIDFGRRTHPIYNLLGIVFFLPVLWYIGEVDNNIIHLRRKKLCYKTSPRTAEAFFLVVGVLVLMFYG